MSSPEKLWRTCLCLSLVRVPDDIEKQTGVRFMADNFEIAANGEFSMMAMADRGRFLLLLGQELRHRAARSHLARSRHWQKLEKLSNRIEHDHEVLAGDYSMRSERFMIDAVRSLAEFDIHIASFEK